MELQAMEIWIAFITLVLAPIIYGMRENANENKRIDVLLNRWNSDLAWGQPWPGCPSDSVI